MISGIIMPANTELVKQLLGTPFPSESFTGFLNDSGVLSGNVINFLKTTIERRVSLLWNDSNVTSYRTLLNSQPV